jgi:thiamine-phosphate pyrophosphorylase
LLTALRLGDSAWRDVLAEQVRGAIAGGIDMVQLRERGVDDAVLAAFARRLGADARGTGTRILINDRADIAIACGLDGVHLREDGVEALAMRRLRPAPFLVGRSVHGAEAAAASAGADYLIAGPLFETISKVGHEGLGLERFAAVVAAAPCPVWAIGGLTPLHVSAVVSAGASGIAAIGAFIPAAPRGDLAARVQELVENLRFRFDSPSSLS